MGQTNEGLRALRTRKGITQEGLRDRSGVPQKTISNLESRGPSRAVVNALRVARALGVSAEDLFASYLDKAKKAPRKRTAVHTHGANG